MATSNEQKADTKAADKANAEVQAKVDDELSRGYRGHTADPHPNEAYSLTSGPDAPPLVEDANTRFAQPGLPKKEA